MFSWVSWPISVGIVPSKTFEKSKLYFKGYKRKKEEEFFRICWKVKRKFEKKVLRYKETKFLKCPISVGIVPFKLFPWRSLNNLKRKSTYQCENRKQKKEKHKQIL